MSKNRVTTLALLFVLGVGLLLAVVAGFWAYLNATATRFHPDPAAAPSSASAPSPEWAATVEQAQKLARAGLSEQNLPGLSVAVGVDHEIVWAEGFGWADLGSHDLDFTGQLALSDALRTNPHHVGVTPETRFQIVGVSMALTSAAVGLLVDQGKLKLDDEIQMYVPEFPKKPWPVTVRELMAHQAGTRNDGGDEAPIRTRCEETLDGLKLDGFAGRPLLFEPGTQYHYSTYGWIPVSAAVESAAHQPFFTFMRDRIFAPLGMTATIPASSAGSIPNLATSYFPRFGGDTRYGPDLAPEGDHACWAGGGAFLSTPSDLVRFAIALDSGTLVQPTTVTVLQTPQRLASGEPTTAGLGWNIETTPLAGQPARLVRQDDRRSIGGSTTLLTFPDRGLVVAVTTNITFADTSTLALGIAQIFAEHRRKPQ
jgi:serine beta-lactamase-like protein LACTB, mitochondrial